MRHGCWVSGGRKRGCVPLVLVFTLGLWLTPVSGEGSPRSYDVHGFEIGNGSHLHHNRNGGYTLRMFEDYEVGEQGKVTEVIAPASDRSVPRTRLLIDVYPISLSAEKALESLRAGSQNWIEFTLGRLAGIYQEVKVRENWNRLELQLFRQDEKFIIRLEGNKDRSQAYQNLYESLLSEILDEEGIVEENT